LVPATLGGGAYADYPVIKERRRDVKEIAAGPALALLRLRLLPWFFFPGYVCYRSRDLIHQSAKSINFY
jgi:hypothetical protein